MEYRAVGNRCAVHFPSLNLPITEERALEILLQKGFEVLEVDLENIARRDMDISMYRRGARADEAPGVVDCSSFTKYLYACRGIWLPRRTIQQRSFGTPVISRSICTNDLVFVSGAINYYHADRSDGVGHVGIATSCDTVIHAANSKARVIETPLEKFISGTKFRGARRYIPTTEHVTTLRIPDNRDVEYSDDIRWIILQTLGKK